MRRAYPLWLAVLALALGVTGCDSVGGDDDEGVRTVIRFQAEQSLQAGKAASHVTVEEAKLLLKTVKFTEVSDEEEGEFETESFVVNLDLAGQANPVVVGEVPEGSYKRVTFKIHKPEDTEPIPDPEFRDGPSGPQRYAVIVRGTVEGAPFELKIRESIQQRVDLSPPLVLDGDEAEVEVTLLADLDRWFVDEDGELLDPRVEDDVDEIADAIKESFRALSATRGAAD